MLVRSTGRLTLIYYFEELFKIVSKKVAKGELEGLSVLEGLVGRKIRETL